MTSVLYVENPHGTVCVHINSASHPCRFAEPQILKLEIQERVQFENISLALIFHKEFGSLNSPEASVKLRDRLKIKKRSSDTKNI